MSDSSVKDWSSDSDSCCSDSESSQDSDDGVYFIHPKIMEKLNNPDENDDNKSNKDYVMMPSEAARKFKRYLEREKYFKSLKSSKIETKSQKSTYHPKQLHFNKNKNDENKNNNNYSNGGGNIYSKYKNLISSTLLPIGYSDGEEDPDNVSIYFKKKKKNENIFFFVWMMNFIIQNILLPMD